MFNSKLFRYKEFTVPFIVYREGELSREDFLQITKELQDLQRQQHDSLMESLEKDKDLMRNRPEIYENLREATELFDEAIEITLHALLGDEEDEDDQFEDAMDTFRRGNLLLADAHFALEEMSERSELNVDL